MANRFFWITLLGACLISLFYFGDIWRAPDSYLFTSSGDGLQGYYQTAWHARYDSTDWQQHSLNYPFGESIFFTGGQPLLSNAARWLGGCDSMVGVSNVFLLSSGILATVFVFLILMRLGVSGPYSSAYSIGIVMLSQQWERFSGHFALSVMWAIPLLLWLMMRYFDSLKESAKSSWFRAAFMAVVLFMLGLIQFYYLFFAVILMFGFGVAYLFRSGIPSKMQFLLQALLLFAVPVAMLQLLMNGSSDVIDRTSIPWGFLVYRSSIWSYLYPFGMPYESWFAFLKPSAPLEWEGLAFVGFSTCIAFMLALVLLVRLKWKKIQADALPTSFIALAIGGILSVLASLAFPFNLGFENLLYKLGAVQQFRGIGRFAFVAFYAIAFVAFSLFLRHAGRSRWMHVPAIVVCLILLVEGHARMQQVSERISNNRDQALSGKREEFSFIDKEKFQAIHPLPYVHVGSENIGLTGDDEAMRKLYDASFALGIPSTAVVMSRTSLSQSFLSCGMAWELMEVPSIVSHFQDNRPLLVLADRAHLGSKEHRLLQFADSIAGDNQFTWYSLPLSAFEDAVHANTEAAELIGQTCQFGSIGNWSNDSLRNFVVDDSTYSVRFSRGWTKLLERPIDSEWQNDTLKVSFWVTDFKRDLIPRTSVEFIQYDAEHNVVDYQTEFMGKRLVGMKGNDGLMEYTLIIQPPTASISMAVENKLIQGTGIQINSILMRPQRMNCRILRGENESLNNRNFPK